MFCEKCGTEVEEGAAFCGECGAPLENDDSTAAGTSQDATSQPVAAAPQLSVAPAVAVMQQGEASQPGGQPGAARKKKIILIAVIAVCLIAIIAIVLMSLSNQRRAQDAQSIAHQKIAFEFNIDVPGFDYASSTPIPMRVSGTDFTGANVSQDFLYDGSVSSVPEVERGQYTISIMASPISGEGTMYKLATPAITAVVTDPTVEEQLRELGHDELIGTAQTQDPSSDSVVYEGGELALTPLAPIDVTDEMLDATRDALENSGYDVTKIEDFEKLVETARNAARQELLAKQTTFSDSRLSLKVPSSWADHWKSDCVVMHSVQSGQVPNAWRYTFTNTANPSERFQFVYQFAGSYGDFSDWTSIQTSVEYAYCYIKNEGIAPGDFNAVVQSVVVKPI